MSSVFQCFNIEFQLAQILTADQSPADRSCNTPQLRLTLGWVPCWTTPYFSVLLETLIFTFYLPKTLSGNQKMMKQSLSLLCEAKRLLKITIWGKVVLQLHLLCTERGKRERVRDRWYKQRKRGTVRGGWTNRSVKREVKRKWKKEWQGWRKRVGDPSGR